MLEIFFWGIVFVISLYVLIKASEYFIDSAIEVGLVSGIPSFIIGVTIVSAGTSLPELASSIVAVLRNSSEIVVGNVVGSNIANIFLVAGIPAILCKRLLVSRENIKLDLLLLLGSALILTAMIWDGVFTLPEAILCVAGIVIYMTYIVKAEKARSKLNEKAIKDERTEEEKKEAKWAIFKALIIIVVCSLVIYLSAKYTVESIIKLSEILGIGQEIIAASALALGTSLPELAVSVLATRKGEADIVVGNIIGSNIFNTLAVMGISALFGTLIIPGSILRFGLPVMLIATLLFIFTLYDKKITRLEGWIAVSLYVLFISSMFLGF